ncbi:TPA: carbon-nitrogen hydrolase, partial [Pseudomonas aeruginosa]|nr:carbon-nitrogen hydrolase [Pseudomonas aeruginosa]
MAKVTVACCQIAPRIGAQEHNLRLAERAIREAARRGANVVVLPELAASGYVFADRGEALALAETRDGPSLGLWKALAGELDLVIVGGFCERLDPQRVANSAALVDADGVRAIYRKAHLWNEESGIFEAGEQPPPVVATRFGRIAVMVCYDLEFPE